VVRIMPFVRDVILIILITESGGWVVSTLASCSVCNIDHRHNRTSWLGG
jgi:hypothetical protein